MKTSFFITALFALVFIGCENSSPNPPANDTPVEDIVNVKDTISVQKFNKWRNAWEKNSEAFMDTSAQFQYFTLPIVDLSEVLAENAAGTKYYFGLEKISTDKYYLKFMLVGTDKNDNDLIDDAKKNYIYDLSKTCPPFCTEG